MKGIVLAGGNGSRLFPITYANNKHLLNVYNKPMCYYPIETLVKAGIKEIMIVVSGPFAGNFISLLKNGEDFGLKKLVYGYQSSAMGIADALSIAEDFADNDNIAVILGDNVTDSDISFEINNFEKLQDKYKSPLAHIFLKKVPDPHRFGVAYLDNDNYTIKKIVEKPNEPQSNLAVTGLYLYDKNVFNFIKQSTISDRGEFEISTVNNMYLERGKLEWSMLSGYWRDAGTFETLYEANKYWFEKEKQKE